MRAIARLKVPVRLRDVDKDPAAMRTLVRVGGKDQTPCLFVDGKPLYESADIIRLLEKIAADAAPIPRRGRPVKDDIRLRRVYEPPAAGEGKRFLVERLWPRGVRKEALEIDGWLREVGPTTALRKWFSHDPAKWDEFRRRYEAELATNEAAWGPILEAAREGPVTLLYSSHDTAHNNAVALRAFLERRGPTRAGPRRGAAARRASAKPRSKGRARPS